jgi:shikimate 5-dehydrogenase
LTYKAKRVINTIYKKLNGEEISESPVSNPLFKNDITYMDKVYRNMIKELNKEIKEQ